VCPLHLLGATATTGEARPPSKQRSSNIPWLTDRRLAYGLGATKLQCWYCLSNLYVQKEEAEAAAAVVRAFEIKMIDGQTEKVYSPIRLWKKENRDHMFSENWLIHWYYKIRKISIKMMPAPGIVE
jgi:hypothetical protein